MDNIDSTPVMFFLLCFVLMLAAVGATVDLIKDRGKQLGITISIFAIGAFSVFLLSVFPAWNDGYAQAKKRYEGQPISICQLPNDINRTIWKPLCPPVHIGNDIVFYAYAGNGGRLYSLYGIKFEPGLTEENFLHTIDGSYLVYTKGTNLLIGPYGEDAKILATNSAK